MILILNCVVLPLLSLASLLVLAPPAQHWVEREAYVMGTTLRIAVAAPSRPEGIRAIEEAFEAVRRVDGLLSTWRDDSEIARLNQAPVGQPVPLSPLLYNLLRDAARWVGLTGGAFDPAIGSLIDAWDLRGQGRIPSRETLARARAAVGIGHFVFADSARTASRTDSASWLDTGGFGKGVALGEARRALLRRQVTAGSLNFGGQVLVIGRDPSGADWTVPVAHPPVAPSPPRGSAFEIAPPLPALSPNISSPLAESVSATSSIRAPASRCRHGAASPSWLRTRQRQTPPRPLCSCSVPRRGQSGLRAGTTWVCCF